MFEMILTSFLRESWADVVQLVSLPLELLGLSLAWIEVIYPLKAREICKVMEALGRITFPPAVISPIQKLAWRLFIIIELALMALSWLTLFCLIERFEPRSISFFGFVFGLLVGPIIGSFICFRLVSWLLNVLSDFSEGRALGTFGLILAALGVLCEVYQVSVLLFGG